jgi:hypothetical protein
MSRVELDKTIGSYWVFEDHLMLGHLAAKFELSFYCKIQANQMNYLLQLTRASLW